MPASDAHSDTAELPAGMRLAVIAEVLYLVNLLLLPGLAFVALLLLYRRHARTASPLARCHLRQTLSGSLWAGLLLILVNGLILALGGYHSPWTWVILILYFTTCHASLVLLGVMGLSRAMAGQPYRYPLIGSAYVGIPGGDKP